MKLWPLTVVAGVALVVAASCTFAVDTSELDEGCAEDAKACGGRCVRQDDPNYGCERDRCTPCGFEAGEGGGPSTFDCFEGACRLACVRFYGCGDCSAPLLTDPANCGACGNACPDGVLCMNGVCGGAGGPTLPEEP